VFHVGLVSARVVTGTGPVVRPSVASLLRRAVRAERRRVLAWAIAGAVTAVVALLAAEPAATFAAVIGLALALWSARQFAGLMIAKRDFERRDTPPRRAFVALMHDPNPRAVRPLLAVWEQRPAAGERLPKPRSVWRCDDELDELESSPGHIELHEAWIDTGRRSWSKPRWVRADEGIAVPHRRALFGRWYVNTSLRRDRPEEARPLTIEDPHRLPATGEELDLGGSLMRSVAGRLVFLAALTALALVLE
jgi:hypothetical protein